MWFSILNECDYHLALRLLKLVRKAASRFVTAQCEDFASLAEETEASAMCAPNEISLSLSPRPCSTLAFIVVGFRFRRRCFPRVGSAIEGLPQVAQHGLIRISK